MTMASIALEDEDNPTPRDHLVTHEFDAPDWSADPMRILEKIEEAVGLNCLGYLID
jgi:hypothetical protein